ncbi:MAG: small multi-drug export protein [Candidatus Thermoplasmatota archaeon]|jgi:uncharacterized membrane protein|nr:small multi-drug export protein [Candidatus Thermoplasmatota archaeon]
MNYKKNKLLKNFKKSESAIVHIKEILGFGAILLIGAIYFYSVYITLTSEQQKWFSALTATYFIPPAGKETIILIGLRAGLPAPIWGLSIWVYDALACVVILTNWWVIELLINHIPAFPFIGIRKTKPRIYKKKVSLKLWYDKLHKKTHEIEAKKYGKILPVALWVFMFIPFQGTGAMSTTIIGTWLGLKYREIFLIVAIGSLLSIVFMVLAYYGFLRILG